MFNNCNRKCESIPFKMTSPKDCCGRLAKNLLKKCKALKMNGGNTIHCYEKGEIRKITVKNFESAIYFAAYITMQSYALFILRRQFSFEKKC